MNDINTQDLFNFRDYVLFLKDKLDNTKYSEVVWVHGDYWAWKTTTMNILKQLYKEDGGIDNILEFSAWRNYYNKEDTVWKALLYELAWKIYDVFESDKIVESIDFSKINSKNIKSFEELDIDNYFEKIDLLIKWLDLQKEKSIFWNIKTYFSKIKEIKNPNDLEKYLKDIKKDLFLIYIKNSCLEIQYNLYQDLKDFDWELEKWSSTFQKNKVLWIFSLISFWIQNIIDFKFEWADKITDLFKKEEQELKKVKIDSLEVIQRKFDILLELYNLISFTDEKINKKPLIIMIDDLDRILPEKSVEIIEILRIFFEKSKSIHFICAIDIRVIEKWIERKFNQLNQWGDLSRIEFEEYLEKIITIPFDLPAIPLVDFDSENNIFWVDTLIKDNFLEINKKDIIWNLQNYDLKEIFKNLLINFLDKDSNLEKHNTNYSQKNKLVEYLKNDNFKDFFNNEVFLENLFSNEYFSNDLKQIVINITKLLKILDIEWIEVWDNINHWKIFIKFLKKIFINKNFSSKLDNEDKKINYIKLIYYILSISILNNTKFTNIIKTWLSANPRKIKRFMDVFWIYYKILLFRNLKSSKDSNIDDLLKYAILLSKMLIIKLEWDEIYKEFIRDKYHLLFIEYVAKNIKDSNMEISFNINKYIKDSKKYKISNLFWMLSISDYFIEKDVEDSKKLLGLYSVYYLYPFIWNFKLQDKIESNENYETLWNINLLKYLYEYDEQKVLLYCTEIFKNPDNILSTITNFKKFITSDNIGNITNIKILNDNLNINGK